MIIPCSFQSVNMLHINKIIIHAGCFYDILMLLLILQIRHNFIISYHNHNSDTSRIIKFVFMQLPLDWLVEIYKIMVEWKYTTMVNGVQCVMMDGILLKLLWYVDNWDFIRQDQLMDQLVMDKEQDPFG